MATANQAAQAQPGPSGASGATFRIWRGEGANGGFVEYRTEVQEGMVVLDVVHLIQATQATDLAVRWNCKAGKCGSCSAEINGVPRLMCMTRLKDLVTDVSWNYRTKARIVPFHPKPPEADGTWRETQADVDRPQEFRKCIE